MIHPGLVWKRPTEIVENPNLFVGGASRFDIEQGMLGDCWLLASVAALCQYQGLLHQVGYTQFPNKKLPNVKDLLEMLCSYFVC